MTTYNTISARNNWQCQNSKVIRRNRRLFQRVLPAIECIGVTAGNADTLRHVTAVGRVHFNKQFVDDDTFSNLQPAQQ